MSLEESIKLAVESLGANLYDIVSAKEHDRNIFRVLVTTANVLVWINVLRFQE